MPILEMHILEGRSVEMKRAAVAAVTDALVDSMQVQAEQVRILITEHPPEHFAVAGTTAAAKREAAVQPAAAQAG